MAQEYDNTNQGVIFKHDGKGNDKAPNYKGKINVDGKDKEIALWLKTSKAGASYFSAKISDPFVKPQGNNENIPIQSSLHTTNGGPGVVPDDLPF